MKKLLFSICTLALVALFVAPSHAQIKTPAPSPGAKFTQAVGLTDVAIEYSRPAVNGRNIFAADGLVPFGKVWRTGANSASKIIFGDDVKIGGKDLKKGSYAILTIPNATEWAVHFYTYETGNWGSYVEKTPALIATAKVTQIPFSISNFSITVEDIKASGASIEFIWDKTVASVPFTLDTDTKVMAAINKTLDGPSAGDYYAAGNYLLSQGRDLDKALMYVQKATKGENPRFWQVRREALILGKLGRKKEAIAAAQKSLDLAMKAGNDDYVKMNKDSIAEWSK